MRLRWMENWIEWQSEQNQKRYISWDSVSCILRRAILAWENPLETVKNYFGSRQRNFLISYYKCFVGLMGKWCNGLQQVTHIRRIWHKSLAELDKWLCGARSFDATFLLNVKWINTAKWLDCTHCCVQSPAPPPPYLFNTSRNFFIVGHCLCRVLVHRRPTDITKDCVDIKPNNKKWIYASAEYDNNFTIGQQYSRWKMTSNKREKKHTHTFRVVSSRPNDKVNIFVLFACAQTIK